MKVLVTGGLGTVGRVLVEELESRKHEVWFCDLSHHHSPRYIRCDVGSYIQLSRIFDEHQFDYVYHLAAEFGRWNGEDFYDTLWRSNVVGTKNLIRLQEKYKFRQIFFSSSEVYGDYQEIMSEDVMDRHEVRQLNDYAMTKWVGEMQLLNSATMHETETVRVRLFNTYGPGEYYSTYRSVICRFIYCALLDLPCTVYLGHHRTSTYVTENNFKAGEVYNIGGEEYHSIKEVSDLILKCIGKDGRHLSYEERESFTTKDKVIDVSKSKRDLEHQALVSLNEGIPRTIEWMKKIYLEGGGQ